MAATTEIATDHRPRILMAAPSTAALPEVEEKQKATNPPRGRVAGGENGGTGFSKN
jgi:hypothetical protein